MKYTFKIAIKYIFSLRKFQFITFISLLSALGIVIGVSALIIVTSLFNGFRDFAEKEIIGIDPHIRLLPKKGSKVDFNEVIKFLKNNPDISFFQFNLAKGIIQHNQNVRVVQLYAIDDTSFTKHPLVAKSLLNIDLNKFGIPLENCVSIGIGLADGLRLLPGEKISILTIEDIDYAIQSLSFPKGKQPIVASIFQTNNMEYDNNFILLPKSLARALIRSDKYSTKGIDIRTRNEKDILSIANYLKEHFPHINVYTWYDLNKDIMNAMQFEKYAVFIVLSLIISIAVFNILASLFMTVLEKKPDIAILLAIGATGKDIQQIFRIQGILVGAISTLIGLIIGLCLTLGQIHYGWLKLNTQKYIISALPMKISIPTVVTIAIVAFLLSYLATIYPSKQASKVLVSESIFKE
ncbi:MAG: hypothetical protein CH6_1959 [Candidatus Kapaibacterium sp.]|nr:MAG: hypothetical protein CH6_1959 [Candidatus Kapabacteria bacterium]